MAGVLTIFVAAVTKYLTRSNLRDNRFYLGYSLRGWWMMAEVAGMAATGGNKRVRWLAYISAESRGKTMSVSLIAQDSSSWDSATYIQGGPSSMVNPHQKCSQWLTQSCPSLTPGIFLNPIKLTVKIDHHSKHFQFLFTVVLPCFFWQYS